MSEFVMAVSAGFWLGILTSVSPCPLTTNIAAVSFIGKQMRSTKKVLLSGLVYTLGRSLAYTVLGVVLVHGLLAAPAVSHFLQKQMNIIAGPLLILVGMVLLDMLSVRVGNNSFILSLQRRIGSWDMWGALLLGILFALSFCPVSAALFFGSLLPLAVRFQSGILIPIVYGVATGLPVMIFALFIVFGAQYIGRIYNAVTLFEKWGRRISGVVFILAGIYFILVHIYGINI